MSAGFQAVPQDAPVYSDTTVEAQNPPEYNSLFGRIKQAKQEASNPVQFVTKSSAIVCGSAAVSGALLISALVPIACIVIGVLRKEKCPIQSNIPIWLIVSGACGLFTAVVKTLTNLGNILRKRKDPEAKQGCFLNSLNCLNGLVGLFSLAWFITGNVWVYGNYNNVVYDPLSTQYCDRLCYLFSFWVITATWISLALACCCICGLMVCGAGLLACLSRSK